jgi:hypothetical protein
MLKNGRRPEKDDCKNGKKLARKRKPVSSSAMSVCDGSESGEELEYK